MILSSGGDAVESGRVDNFLWGDAVQISGRPRAAAMSSTLGPLRPVARSAMRCGVMGN